MIVLGMDQVVRLVYSLGASVRRFEAHAVTLFSCSGGGDQSPRRLVEMLRMEEM